MNKIERMCFSKKAFKSEELALQYAAYARSRHAMYNKEARKQLNDPLRAYECPWCGEWHTTKKEYKPKQ